MAQSTAEDTYNNSLNRCDFCPLEWSLNSLLDSVFSLFLFTSGPTTVRKSYHVSFHRADTE